MSTTTETENALERLRALSARVAEHDRGRAVLDRLGQGERGSFDGVIGSSAALLAAALGRAAPRALLVVLPEIDDIDTFCDDLALFTDREPLRFPAAETASGEPLLRDEMVGQRIRTLKRLAAARTTGPAVVVTCIQSLLQPVPSQAAVRSASRTLRVGDRVPVEALSKWLAEHAFHGTSAVEMPGEFSLRGGLLDIFAPDWERPVRIEFFDDEIESIREFEVDTQRSAATRNDVDVTVVDKALEGDTDLTDHLPDASWVLLVEPEQIEVHGKQYLERAEQPEALLGLPTVMSRLGRFPFATAGQIAGGPWEAACQLGTESVERFSGEVGRVKAELERAAAGQQLYLVCATEAEIKRLREILAGAELIREDRVHYVIGYLRKGFRLSDDNTLVLSANELFQRGSLRRVSRRRAGRPLDSFLELRTGDLVVHLAHGIGRYRGIERLNKNGQVEEHLQIEFAEGAKVYVPATRIDLVQKYVGGTKRSPRLARLGGAVWQKQKKAAESAVMDMAVEMLDLQAERLSRIGIALGPDGEWQREFDASFPYEETADQLAAIDEIKNDMESPRPMDRLLCGDVGFGKTELAMRAAFKAVDHGYQVAVLVPTTVLAEQHFHTFTERLAEFPFDIARLSRFCSPREQKEITAGLRKGTIDIVIGTHRLASRDVAFHNLGLLVIDEEQRFGVEVKERLKTLKSTVDVLTMTATPIPRTLHMSLVGVRDISNLETAPQDRVGVETRLARFDDKLIRHAVLRELNRGGQVYFVHNRVQDIDRVAAKLRAIVPEASLQIAHGQMHEHDLERVMVDFVAHRFDLLLATTIVESGLDIPNANTIFIDEADRYGLADLHQLRGRVGRYKHQAYCYLLIDRFKHISPNAAKRLRAIEEFSEMGAGFSLAMRDLEIRGAGNLLGTQQSGHIATVGYEFYCQLLENAVRTLKHLPRKLPVDVDIDLPGEAFLPDDYVPDMRTKIELYRRLRRTESYDEIADFAAELRDRFGAPPAAAQWLVDLAELRLDAAIWQIAAVTTEENKLLFTYRDRGRIEQLVRRVGRGLRIVDAQAAACKVKDAEAYPGRFFEAAKSILQTR